MELGYMRDFAFIEGEAEIIELVNEKIPYSDKIKTRQKRRELFHALVFLRLCEKYNNCLIDKSEKPDFILHANDTYNAIGLEITEVLDSNETYGKTQKKLDELLVSSYKDGMSHASLSQESMLDAAIKLREVAKKKAKKLKGYKQKTNYNILVCVTFESKDNPEINTGHWYERTLKHDDLLSLKHEFDELYFLNYGSSGKDGGPTLMQNEDAALGSEVLN